MRIVLGLMQLNSQILAQCVVIWRCAHENHVRLLKLLQLLFCWFCCHLHKFRWLLLLPLLFTFRFQKFVELLDQLNCVAINVKFSENIASIFGLLAFMGWICIANLRFGDQERKCCLLQYSVINISQRLASLTLDFEMFNSI